MIWCVRIALLLSLVALVPLDAAAQLSVNCAARSAAGSALEKVIVPMPTGAAKRLFCHYADSAVITLRLNAACDLAHVDMIDEVARLHECRASQTDANKCRVVCGAE